MTMISSRHRITSDVAFWHCGRAGAGHVRRCSVRSHPDEPVSVTGMEPMPLRTAVSLFSKLTLLEQAVTLIFRENSAAPNVLRKDHVDWLRTLPAFQDPVPQNAEAVKAGPVSSGVPPSEAHPAPLKRPITCTFGLDGERHTAWRFYLALQLVLGTAARKGVTQRPGGRAL